MTLRTRIKRLVYRSVLTCYRLYWSAVGGRRVKAFGQSLRLAPNTSWLDHRSLRYPREPFPSRIVRHTDFVQINAICRHVREFGGSPTIVDVGAFHGEYAILLGKMIQPSEGKLIAVEPNPESFQVLERNVRLNGLRGTVICERVAISDRPGELSVSLHGSQSQVGSFGGAAVRAVGLDELLAKHGIEHVDLLIIDVEGAELAVLRSFPWETAKVETVFCELHSNDWHLFGCTGSDFEEFLETHRLRCIDMYFKEHRCVEGKSYIGPTVLIRAPD